MSHPAEPKSETVKVVDRRRVNVDGTPRHPEPSAAGAHAEAEPVAASRVAELAEELLAAQKRIDELARAYQASQEDREDFKQRLNRERQRMVELDRAANATLVIEAIDQLDLCLAAADRSPLSEGVRLVRENLLKKLVEAGVERLELLGTPFDPNAAEATDMEVVASEAEDGLVTAVTRAGYRLGERVIRPAQVRVARYVRPARA